MRKQAVSYIARVLVQKIIGFLLYMIGARFILTYTWFVTYSSDEVGDFCHDEFEKMSIEMAEDDVDCVFNYIWTSAYEFYPDSICILLRLRMLFFV